MSALDSFEIDYSSGLPVWIQIKNRLAYLIASGQYDAGDRLPTVRALAVDLDISYNTVNRAYTDLEREGFISTRKGRGTFVADISGRGVTVSDESFMMLVDELIRTGGNVGMQGVDIVAAVEKRIKEREHAS